MSFPAWAEDPAQCRRYASAQTESIIQTINLRAQDAVVFIWNRLYSRCVLSETGVPEIEYDWRKAMAEVLNIKPPNIQPLSPAPGSVPATDDLPPPKIIEPRWPSGFITYCKRYFRSFDPTDGTVLMPGSKGRRTKCPFKG